MGTEINNRKIILLSVAILSTFFVAFVIIAYVETQHTEKKEMAGIISVPQKTQQTSGQIAGVLEEPTVLNITTLDNSSNETNTEIKFSKY